MKENLGAISIQLGKTQNGLGPGEFTIQGWFVQDNDTFLDFVD